MANFSVKASFDGSELVQGFKDVKDEVNGLATAGQSAGKSLDNMLKQKNATSNYSRQLGQIKQQLTDLSVNYARLSDADKSSDFGKAMAARIDELTAKAQELKGVMDEVNVSLSGGGSGGGGPKDYGEHWAEIQRQAEQTYAKFEGVQKVAAGVASGFAAVQGAAALLAPENENLQKALLKVQAAMAIAQGIGGIKDFFEGLKQLKAAFTFTTAATTINTAAQTKNTVATVGATTAQKAFNKAVLANPYVAIAAAVVAVGTALFAFSKNAKKARQEQEKLNKLMEEQKELNERTAKSMGTVVGEYRILQREFSSLSSVADKQQWIEDNQTAFNNLGLAISSVNDADNIFINQSDDVIAALKARAKAEALKEKYKESFIAAEEKKMKIEEFRVPVLFSASGKLPEVATEMGLNKSDFEYKWGGGQSGAGTYTPTSERAIAAFRKIYDRERKALEDEIDETTNIWEAKLEEAEEEAAEAAAKVNKYFNKRGKQQTTTTTTTDTEEDIYGEKSLIAAQKEVSKLQDKLNRLDVDSPDFEPTKQALIAAEKKVEEIRQKMAAENPDVQESVDVLVQAYEDAEKEISELTKKYKIGILDEETAQKQIDNINAELQKLGLNPIEVKLKPIVTSEPETLADKHSEITGKINMVLDYYDMGAINKEYAQSLIDDLNEQLGKLGLDPIHINLNLEHLESQISKAQTMFDAIGAVGNVISSIDGVYNAFKDLDKQMDEAENGWERFMVGFNAGMQILNVFTTVMGTINSLMTAFNTIQAISTGLKMKDTVASSAKATADLTAAGAAGTEAAANTAAATAGAAKSVSWLPIVGPILAVAAIAAVIGAIMSARNKGKYATGGIVPGSGIGDMDLVRVNGGEMILNSRQQANLFRMIDQNRLPQPNTGGGEVVFRIQGDTLVGAINNYNKKRSRA